MMNKQMDNYDVFIELAQIKELIYLRNESSRMIASLSFRYIENETESKKFLDHEIKRRVDQFQTQENILLHKALRLEKELSRISGGI